MDEVHAREPTVRNTSVPLIFMLLLQRFITIHPSHLIVSSQISLMNSYSLILRPNRSESHFLSLYVTLALGDSPYES